MGRLPDAEGRLKRDDQRPHGAALQLFLDINQLFVKTELLPKHAKQLHMKPNLLRLSSK